MGMCGVRSEKCLASQQYGSLLMPVHSHLSPQGGPGYSALIFDNITQISAQGINGAIRFARSGLPIVFVGPVPDQSPYFTETSTVNGDLLQSLLDVSPPRVERLEACVFHKADLALHLTRIQQLDNVHRVDDVNGLRDLLAQLDIQPDSKFEIENPHGTLT